METNRLELLKIQIRMIPYLECSKDLKTLSPDSSTNHSASQQMNLYPQS